MAEHLAGCVLLGERHYGLIEGIRGLLETAFERVFIVADEASLIEGAEKLQPDLVVTELALVASDLAGFVRRLHECAPGARLLLLSVHEHPTIARSISAAGADGFVAKRSIATDLLPAVEAVLAGERYLSRAVSREL
jgi:DNA-binding NarL/FixJ family response regulator